ncbi:hypothetical protein J3R30DRAFT_3865124, partial [Lentinula aciculospora]
PPQSQVNLNQESGSTSSSTFQVSPVILDLVAAISPIYNMCCLLAAWLILRAGVSCNTANTVLKALHLIIATALELLYAALQSSGFKIAKPSTNIVVPLDIHTPDIQRLFCCPTCFKVYPANTALKKCDYKRTARAHTCDTALWTYRSTKKGTIKIPRCLYTTTSFKSWLQSFLSRPSIDKCLHKTFSTKTQYPVLQERMYNVQDSPFGNSIRPNLNSPYDLVFSVYVDWFNPLGNKQAGKQISCGAIVLYCLNLPLDIIFLPENIFVVGMMPAPHGPTVWNIHHILDHYCDSIMEFDLPGKIMQTSVNPDDLLASKKFTGFGSPSAKYFYVESLDYNSWELRNGDTKNASTLSEKEKLFKQNGVRWIPQYNIPYFDPVLYVILGMMHNDEEFSEMDTEGALSELEDLAQELEEWSQHSTSCLTDEMQDITMSSGDNNSTPTATPRLSRDSQQLGSFLSLASQAVEWDIPDIPQDDQENDPDFVITDIEGLFKFTDHQVAQIRQCISEVLLPTWIERPPQNLGEKSHGKLKAHQLLNLFTVIFPLIMPELWANGSDREKKLLKNFCDLVAATNIIASYSTTSEEAGNYRNYFYHSLPNHHYGMHNTEHLKFWGPLTCLSEFPGERLNSEFGKISTNNHFNEMEKAKLNVILNENPSKDKVIQDLIGSLAPVDVYEFACEPSIMTSYEVEQFYKKHDEFTREEYNTLLHYLISTGRSYSTAYPEGLLYQNPATINFNKLTSHEAGGNGAKTTGCIVDIWQLPLEIKEYLPVPPSQKLKNPYISDPCSTLCSELVQRNFASFTYLIEPEHIISHVAVYKRPTETMVIVWSLNRGHN